jgi:hypothetical protein
MSQGVTHVALNSRIVLTVRATPIYRGLYPEEIKNEIIWPENDRTVK